jgi:hypothetical protein
LSPGDFDFVNNAKEEKVFFEIAFCPFDKLPTIGAV